MGWIPAGRQEVLDLTHDLGHNKGMNLLFSSHLLPDVEAVCDYVIVLGGGKLLAQGQIQELKQLHEQTFDVRLKADMNRSPSGWRRGRLRDRIPRRSASRANSGRSVSAAAVGSGREPERTNPLFAAAAKHAGRGVSECGGAHLMPIFDQGYQHWSGQLSGHTWRWLAITRRGVRTALQGRVVRWALFVAWLPAIVLVFVLCFGDSSNGSLPWSIRFDRYLTSLLGQPILAGPRDYRVEIWTHLLSLFSIVGIVVLDGARAARRTEPDQPGLAL